jgi:hypothetical protein
MTDLAGVEHAMVQTVAAALFPGTTYLDGTFAASSVAGCSLAIYRGYPTAANIDADMLAGRAHVGVFPEQGMTRLVSRYAPQWVQASAVAPALVATVSGRAVTLSRTAAAGQVVGVQFGYGAAPQAYAYRLVSTDTLATAASGLAAAIPGAASSGAVVTLPTSAVNAAAMVVSDQTASIELRRQQQGFRISCFCPSPLARDAVAGAVDAAFALLLDDAGHPTQFITTADGTKARVQYRATYVNDAAGKERVWRRDLCYTVEYPTILSQLQPSVMFANADILAGGGLLRVGAADLPTSVFYDAASGTVLLDSNGALVGTRTTTSTTG